MTSAPAWSRRTGRPAEHLPNYRAAYIAPLLKQAKAIAWDYVKLYTAPILGIACNETELRCDFPNGTRYRLFGADNPDGMRGLYLDRATEDEPADMRHGMPVLRSDMPTSAMRVRPSIPAGQPD
ncbi:hypothetical protein ACVDG5_006905 [Mesorhizobium sp. ORM6]